MSPGGRLRVLGVSVPNVSDWREPMPQGQWSQFFGALTAPFDLVDVIHPELSQAERYINYARTFHPDRAQWKAHAGFNPWLAKRRTATVQAGLEQHRGAYELILQVQTVCAPGFERNGAPYVIYTDNTMALTRREYPRWAPLSQRAAAQWERYEADICRSAQMVFTFSEYARGSVVEDYGVAPQRAVSVGAGANQMLGELGEKDYSVPRALFVGIDFARKGGPELLEAWRRVREHVPGAQLTIAGPAQELAPELPPGVDWIGWVDRAALARLYEQASVFVLPSIFDPCPNVFREAMGYGVPCIGSSCCAIPEIIEDGVTGLVVPVRDPERLATALIELLSQPERAAEMGRSAYSSLLQGNRWSDVAERIATHVSGAGDLRMAGSER